MTEQTLNVDISPERIRELRAVLGKLDPSGRKGSKKWILEIYSLDGGLVQKIDIRTGREIGRRRQTSSKPG